MAKRGHSIVVAKKTVPADEDVDTGYALIPLKGGASPETVKDLPPLALHRDHWEEIGRRMGWLKEVNLDNVI